MEKAIKGMLPHNALGRQLFRKLKVYKGAEHPHGAQQPQPYQLNPPPASNDQQQQARRLLGHRSS